MASMLVHLRPENALVQEQVLALLGPPAEGRPTTLDTRLGDYDNAYWRIEVVESAPTQVFVCLEVPCYAQLKALGVEAHLQGIYGSMMSAVRAGASVSLCVDAAALPQAGGGGGGGGGGASATAEATALRVAQLRMHVTAFPYLRAMSAVAAGRGLTEQPVVLLQRPREAVYLLTRADRVLAIYHLDVAEPTDRAIARVVAQELTEAYRAVNSAPPVSWSEREPPMELKGFPGLDAAPSDTSIGYITFTIFPTAYKTDAQREAVASQLALFRSFLQYHLKAAKTYLHARMRSRAEHLQKILNRAIPEDPFADKDKKLSSGRTFVKSVNAVMAAGRLSAAVGGGEASAASGGGSSSR